MWLDIYVRGYGTRSPSFIVGQSIISISIDNRGWWCVFCEGQEAIVQEAINLSTRSAIGYTETDHSQASHYVVRVQAMDGCDAMISGPEGQFKI